MLIAIFVGWVWEFDKVIINVKEGAEKLFDEHQWMITFWKIFLKYFAPILIFVVLLQSIGILDKITALFE